MSFSLFIAIPRTDGSQPVRPTTSPPPERLLPELPSGGQRRSTGDRPGGRTGNPRSGLSVGWVIAKAPAPPSSVPRYLQIATGQWCDSHHATWFPVRSAAEIYAIDRGYRIGGNIRIVYLNRHVERIATERFA